MVAYIRMEKKSHAWSKSERFQNGRWLIVKKIGFAQYIIYLLISMLYTLIEHALSTNDSARYPSRILWPKRNVLGQKNKQTNKQTKKEKFGVSSSLNH